MSSLVAVNMSPEEMICTFKQKSKENFKEAWSRIHDCHGKTQPKMTLSLLLSSFYFGLALRYRYALDQRCKWAGHGKRASRLFMSDGTKWLVWEFLKMGMGFRWDPPD
jgi:hypothetical protein